MKTLLFPEMVVVSEMRRMGNCLANGRRHLASAIVALTPTSDAAVGVQVATRNIESVTESKNDLLP